MGYRIMIRIKCLFIKYFLKNRVMNNASWLIGGKIVQMVISFFVGILTARFLGPSNFGLISRTAAFLTFFTPVCTLGISSIIINELIANPKRTEEILGSGIGIRCIASIASMLFIQILVFFWEKDNYLFFWVTFLQSGMLFFQSFDLIEYWYQSKLEAKYISIIALLAYIGTAGYKIVLLAMGKGVSWFAFANSLDYLLIAVMYVLVYRFRDRKKLIFKWTQVSALLKKSYEFILSSLMVAVYAEMDKVMLGEMLDDTAVGLYSVGTKICSMWVFVLSAVINSIRPSVIEAKEQKNQALYHNRIIQMYSIVLWMSIGVSVVFCLLAEFIIVVLYGAEYVGAKDAFRIVTWYTGASYLGVARSTWMVCENRQKYEKVLAGLGAISNIILNLLLIPVFGICGAAWATLITQILTNILFPFFFKDLRENSILIMKSVLYPVKVLRKF